jgi:uncharacterized protein (TIGR00369 family)
VEQVADGIFVTRLELGRHHQQQDGFAHAGVIATMADHTAGYAAYTTVDEGYRILTVEFKINYLRPAAGPYILCKSKVIGRGRKIIVSESEVFSPDALPSGRGAPETERLVAKAMVTLTAVRADSLAGRYRLHRPPPPPKS